MLNINNYLKLIRFQGTKASDNIFKSKNDFLIHEDVIEEKDDKNICPPESPEEVKGPKTLKDVSVYNTEEDKKNEDDKLVLSDAVILMPQMLKKDLKVCDEEPMSESHSSPENVVSPMSIESVRISSPLVRHSKLSLQYLYDMDEYRKEIFQYLLQAEVCIYARYQFGRATRNQTDIYEETVLFVNFKINSFFSHFYFCWVTQHFPWAN